MSANASPRDEAHDGSKASTAGTLATIVKTATGTGLLALPYACQRGGVLLSIGGTALILLWNVVCCDLLVACKEAIARHPHEPDESYHPVHASQPHHHTDDHHLEEQHVEEDAKGSGHAHGSVHPQLKGVSNRSTYARVGLAAMGRWGGAIVDASVIITQVGACVVYFMTVNDLMAPTGVYIPLVSGGGAATLNRAVNIAIYAAMIFPLTCVKHLGPLAKAASVGIAAMLAGCAVVIAHGVQVYGWGTFLSWLAGKGASGLSATTSSFWPQEPAAAGDFFGAASYAFGSPLMAFNFQESMQRPDQFGFAMRWSSAAVWILQVVAGGVTAGVYSAQVGGVDQNVMEELQPGDGGAIALRILVSLAILMTYPIILAPVIEIAEKAMVVPDSATSPSAAVSCEAHHAAHDSHDSLEAHLSQIHDLHGDAETVAALPPSPASPEKRAESGKAFTFTPSPPKSRKSSPARTAQTPALTPPLTPLPATAPRSPRRHILALAEHWHWRHEASPLIKNGGRSDESHEHEHDVHPEDKVSDHLEGAGATAAAAGGGAKAGAAAAAAKPKRTLQSMLPNLLRFALVVFSAGAAVFIPSFGTMVSVLGSTATGAACFVCPPLFHLKLAANGSKKTRFVDAALLAVGVVTCVYGTVMAVVQLA